MRNLKKVLALVLALVMTMSLVTIANAAEFTDAGDISYEEAVDVMSTIGVFEGFENGDFKPTGTLTREQAAKIITYMLLGENADRLSVSSSRYSDVAATRWSAPAIEYCSTLGIIAGNGDGTFSPSSNLTGYAFAKMLLTALGYKSDVEGFTGMGWTINVTRLATQVGLDDGIESLNWNSAISREEACQMALNAVKSPMVAYDGGNTIVVNGAEVSFGSGNAYYVTTTIAKEQRISEQTLSNSGEYTVEFGERYFPKLELDADYDAFGRPSYTWIYDGSEICTAVNSDLLYEEYTTEVTGKDLYDLLGSNTVDTYKFYISIDGVSDHSLNSNVFDQTSINRNNKKAVGATGNGVLTQVFVDTNAKRVDISIINTYLAKATADYNDKTDSVSLNVYDVENAGNSATPVYVKSANTDANKTVDNKVLMKVSGEDFDIAEVLEDDFYLVTVADGEIQTMDAPEIVPEATLTSFTVGEKVEADGETYKYASTAEYDFEVLDNWTSVGGAVNLKDQSYNVYLDQYGYLIGIDLVEAASNYLFLTGIDANNSNLSAVSADAYALFLDGSAKPIKVNLEKSTLNRAGNNAILNTWCTYTTNNEGVYTLKEVETAINVDQKVKVAQWSDVQADVNDVNRDIDLKHVSLPGAAAGTYSSVYGNDNTVYLNAKLSAIDNGNDVATVIISGVQGVTTGVKNANLSSYDEDDVQGLKTSAEDATWATATDDNVSYGVYTLYKSNGYIIGAVVVGKDEAASKNLVFITSSDVSTEGYDQTKDEWTWKRTASQNGQEIELLERGDSLTYLNAMSQYGWYQVQLDADGYVIGYSTAASALGTSATTAPTAYITSVDNVPTAVATAGMDTVLYSQSFTDETKVPQLIGSVLYATTTSSTGFFVDENVNIVLIQKNDLKTTTSYDTGVGNLENVLATLNAAKDDNCYDYTISAVIEGGAAKTVVIQDTINDPTGNAGTTPSTPGSSKDIFVDLSDAANVEVYTTAATMSNTEAANAITTWLTDNGYTIKDSDYGITNSGKYTWLVRANGSSWDEQFVFDAVSGNGSTADTINTGAKSVTVDGKAYAYRYDNIKDLLTALGKEAGGETYYKYSTDGGLNYTYEASSSSTAVTANTIVVTNYLKIQDGSGDLANSDLVKLSTLETDGTSYYALATATLAKGDDANVGTGIAVNSNATYLPYNVTYAQINAADGDDTDGIATIDAVGQVKVSEKVYSGTTNVYPVAHGTQVSTGIADIGDGTWLKLNGTMTEVSSLSSSNTLTGDTTAETGYVKVTGLTNTSSLASNFNVAWSVNGKSVAANDFILNGDVVTVVLTVKTAYTNGTGGNVKIQFNAGDSVDSAATISDTVADTDLTSASGVVTIADGGVLAIGEKITVNFTAASGTDLDLDIVTGA